VDVKVKTKRKFSLLLFLLGAALIVVHGVSGYTAGAAERTYPNANLLVETEWVAEHVDDPAVRLVDVRSASDYARGHIRNAVNIPIRNALTVTTNGVRGMVASGKVVEEVMGRAGIDKETRVVVYDSSGGLWAARLFWVLDYYGHQKVSLLNGGLVKWSAEGRELTAEAPTVRETLFSAKPQPEKLATMDWIKERLDDEEVVVLDARSHDEYVGKDRRSAQGGHIPGAVNLNWVKTITGEQKTFLPYKELRNLVFLTGAKRHNEVVTYCQTGVRGAHLYFVLKLLGFENVRLYDGSWQEWGNVGGAPVEQKVDPDHKTC
jgi:thiosulfate/3-mercaptopyruvate sulfurtransferase